MRVNSISSYQAPVRAVSPPLSHPLAPLTTRPLVLDGDEGPAHTLCLASHTVVGVCFAVLAAHGLVRAVALDGVAGAAGGQRLHQTHRVEQAVLLALLWKKETGRK